MNSKQSADIIELPTKLDFDFDASFTTVFENFVSYLVIYKHSEE